MAAKRFHDESDTVPDRPDGKRYQRPPLFASVISEALMVKYSKDFFSMLEPLLRKTVREEVDRALHSTRHMIHRSPTIRIHELEDSSLELTFSKSLKLPVFTGSKIEDEEGKPLQVILVNKIGGKSIQQPASSSPIKVELLVLDGDFPPEAGNDWTPDEFERSIVRERDGKRPLLAGELLISMRGGTATVGEIEFTDNSSWIRCRKFRLGARVASATPDGRRIKEAMTESFKVRDHRGELYKKHYPPHLEDEVWRLEKIGKGGVFHEKLAQAGVKKVEDFLRLSTVHPSYLRQILGQGMSDKIWEVTMKHALTCDIGDQRYLYRCGEKSIILNSMCHIVGVLINGQTYSPHILTYTKAQEERLLADALKNWDSLEEFPAGHTHSSLLTYHGDHQEPLAQDVMLESLHNYNIGASLLGGSLGLGTIMGLEGGSDGLNGWTQNPNQTYRVYNE